jgi:hypothetical protein
MEPRLTKQRELPPITEIRLIAASRSKRGRESTRDASIYQPTSLYSLPLPSSTRHRHQYHDKACIFPLENSTQSQYSASDRGRYSDSCQLHSAPTSTSNLRHRYRNRIAFVIAHLTTLTRLLDLTITSEVNQPRYLSW